MIDSKYSRIRHLIISFLLIIAAAAYCELYLRAQFIRQHKLIWDKYEQGRSRSVKKDPDLVYKGIPSAENNNSQGYEDTEHSFTKPANTYRIVIIGDSIAIGQGMPRDKTFGKILEQQLNADSKDKKIEIILLAMTGYNTAQELVVLKKQVFRYAPDLILWSYVLNDPASAVFHDASGELGLCFYEPKVFAWNYFARKWFYFREQTKAQQLHCAKTEYHSYLHCVYWDEIDANFKKIGQLSKDHHVPIVFVIHPVFFRGLDNFYAYPLTNLHVQLIELAEKYGMHGIDLLNPYASYKPGALNQHPSKKWDPWHPNTQGHRVAGEYLAPILEKTFLKP